MGEGPEAQRWINESAYGAQTHAQQTHQHDADGYDGIGHNGQAHDSHAHDPIGLDGESNVGFQDDWQFQANAGAVTVAWVKGVDREIVEADTAINPHFDWSASDDVAGAAFDLRNALTHELGHALGLPDIKDPREATMFYMILPRETMKRDLAEKAQAKVI